MQVSGEEFYLKIQKIPRHEGQSQIQCSPHFLQIIEDFGSRAETLIVSIKKPSGIIGCLPRLDLHHQFFIYELWPRIVQELKHFHGLRCLWILTIKIFKYYVILAIAGGIIFKQGQKTTRRPENLKTVDCVVPWHSLALDNGCVTAIYKLSLLCKYKFTLLLYVYGSRTIAMAQEAMETQNNVKPPF